MTVGQATVIQHLQQRVEDIRVRLLDLVEQHHPEGPAAHRLGELASLLEPDVARRRAHEPRYGVPLLVLGHVHDDHVLLVVEQVPCQGPCELGLAHARRPKEDEAAERAPGVSDPRPRPPDGVRHSLDGLLLADDALVQALLHVDQLLSLVFEQAVDRYACPQRDQAGHVLRIDHVGHSPAFSWTGRPRLVLLDQTQALGAKLRCPLVLVAPGVRLLLVARLPDPPLQLLQRVRHDLPVDAHLAGRLVDQVHGLVRQKAVCDVAPPQAYGGLECAVGHTHLVVRLVPGPQGLQHLDRRLDVRLLHQHGLEPALQGGVLLDVPAVLPLGRCAQDLYLAAGEGRLHDVASVDRALRRTRAHNGVKLV